jgi:hypothetical protein
MDPLGTRKRRRSTSKLTSLESQELLGEEAESDEEDEETTEIGSEMPIKRDKRSRCERSWVDMQRSH